MVTRSTTKRIIGKTIRPVIGGDSSGGQAAPGVDDYKRPGGVDNYLRPGGTDLYKRPA